MAQVRSDWQGHNPAGKGLGASRDCRAGSSQVLFIIKKTNLVSKWPQLLDRGECWESGKGLPGCPGPRAQDQWWALGAELTWSAVEVKGDSKAACRYLEGSCKWHQIYTVLSSGMCLRRCMGLHIGRFRLNTRKIFIRIVMHHQIRLSMEAVEFLLEVFWDSDKAVADVI